MKRCRRHWIGCFASGVAIAALSAPSRAIAEPDTLYGEQPPADVSAVAQPMNAAPGPLPDDFQRTDGGWLVLEFPSSVSSRVESLLGLGASFRARLSADLGQPVLDHVLVRVARTPEQMVQLAPAGAPPPAYASAVAYPAEHLVVLSLQAPATWEGTDLGELLGHELTHLALADAVSNHDVPRWFNEGLAVHESGELPWARLRGLWEATLSKRLLPLAELDKTLPSESSEVSIAYAESADVVRFLMRDSDRARFGSLIQRVRAGTAFDRALQDAYNTDVRKLEYEWREELAHRFGLFPLLTGGGLIWILIVGLAAAAWMKKRRRAKLKLAQWAREEAEVDAAIATARTSGSAEAAEPSGVDDVPPRVPSIPVVEHEGRWYTLH